MEEIGRNNDQRPHQKAWGSFKLPDPSSMTPPIGPLHRGEPRNARPVDVLSDALASPVAREGSGRVPRRRRRAQPSPIAGREVAARDGVSPSLRSLVAPWAVLAAVSVVACAVVVSRPLEDDDIWGGHGLASASRFARNLIGVAEDGGHKTPYNEAHKPLHPLDSTDYVGFACAIVGLMIAAGGGIGGGGILVPIYILVMGFSPKHAIPLSNITVFGGAIANTYLNSRKRHPHADRPLVDWDLILVMEPLTIAGALLGAFLNKLLPETFLVVMLVLLLSFTANNTLKKALKMYAIESRAMREAAGLSTDGTKESELTRMVHDDEDEEDEEAGEGLLEFSDDCDAEEEVGGKQEMGGNGEGSGNNDGDDNEDLEDVMLYEELQDILDEERSVPMMNVTILVSMFVVVLFINLMKGGGALKSPLGITCGSKSFWAATALMLVWILVITAFSRAYLVKRFERKKAVGYQYIEGDIQWNGRATIVYPGICCLAGFFAGMFGVGGGIVKGPLMLAMGVHPKVSSASSACMILFTSFTATTSFIAFGLLVPDYAVICFIVGILATLVGQIGLFYLMAKFQRNSYIAFSIGGVVLLSAFLMTIQSMVSIAERTPGDHGSGGICGKDH